MNSNSSARSTKLSVTPTKPYVGMDLSHESIQGYRILHRLGVGGMAEVYLAFHETLQRHVAIKVLRSDLAASSDHSTRFLQEARAAASLIHPNIVQVYDVGSSGIFQFIAQEYIPGITLRSLIQRRGVLSVSEGLSITLQIASALSKAASVGVVHRDIKPDNILLTSEGEVKVADFGLARARSQNLNLTEVGVALGTPLYMSPEQIQGKTVDARSDLYSLGITAYEMFAGQPPFKGDTPLALALQHVQNVPPDLSVARPDLDLEVVAIINKLLAKDVDERFATAADLIRSIRKVSDSLSLSVSLEHPHPLSGIIVEMPVAIGAHTTRLQTLALRETSGKSKSKRGLPRAVWLAALACVAAAIGSVFLVTQLDRKPLIEPPGTWGTMVKKRTDVVEQFFYAMTSNRPADWEAVAQYFPPEDSPLQKGYNIKAWLHLAWHAISINKVDDAISATDQILKMNSVEPIMLISARIAKSIALQKAGNASESSKLLKDSKDLFASLDEKERKRVESTLPPIGLSHWYSRD